MVDELRRNATDLDWTFLSNRAQVLICIAREQEARLREVAARITERAVHHIVAELAEAGYLSRQLGPAAIITSCTADRAVAATR